MTRMRIPGGALMAIGLSAAAGPLRAQGSVDELKPGDRVRVWTVEPPLRGVELQVRRVEPGGLIVSTPRWADTMPAFRPEIPRQALIRLDVQRGRVASPRYRKVAVLGGFAVGMATGLVAGMIADSHPYSEGDGVLILTPLGTLAGGIVGLIVGNNGRPVWKTLATPWCTGCSGGIRCVDDKVISIGERCLRAERTSLRNVHSFLQVLEVHHDRERHDHEQ